MEAEFLKAMITVAVIVSIAVSILVVVGTYVGAKADEALARKRTYFILFSENGEED